VFDGLRVLVTGGTGSLGKTVVRRLLAGESGRPVRVTVFSRDEAKQHDMRLSYLHRESATDDIIYRHSQELLSFRIGDVRDYGALARALGDADVVVHAAALKQVPSCEYFPAEAVSTNVIGALNIVRAIRELRLPVRVVGCLDRQGLQADQRHGDDQGGDGADPRRGEPGLPRHALCLRALWQRHRVARLRRPALRRPDRRRRPRHDYPARDDALPAQPGSRRGHGVRRIEHALPGETYVPTGAGRPWWTSPTH
jgi:NAD(P)-dependent dehydrogenase (short-subunit alcohol dehydrogenase family)